MRTCLVSCRMFSFGLAFVTEKNNQAYVCNIVQKSFGSTDGVDCICPELCLVLNT